MAVYPRQICCMQGSPPSDRLPEKCQGRFEKNDAAVSASDSAG